MRKLYTISTLLTLAFAAHGAVPASLAAHQANWRDALEKNATLHQPRLNTLKITAPARSPENPQVSFTAQKASFYKFGDIFENGTDVYYLFLSSGDNMSKGNPTAPGQMARVLLVTEASDATVLALPTGTFTGSEDLEPSTFVPSMTELIDAFYNPDDPEDNGIYGYSYETESGTLTITAGDAGYDISLTCEAVLYDESYEEADRTNATVTYSGQVPYEDIYGYTPLDGDTVMDIPNASGRYSDGDYTITFYGVELDEDGFIIGPGHLFNTEIFVEDNGRMNLDDLVGEFTPVDVFTAGPTPGTFMQGVWYDIFGGYYAAIGTALTIYDDDLNEANVGLAADGTVKVSRDGDIFTFDFDLVTPENDRMTGRWTGPIADYIEDFSPEGVASPAIGSGAIRGGKGCITAPAGARAYNLSGAMTGLSNLPAGIYIVRSGNETAKVVVR